ncbi:hypothetical protein KY332_04380 [Candidatus Woesearchaeota archaeon]|nr:hypothetical protein [Candidatus Woesearchaeota archaeon]
MCWTLSISILMAVIGFAAAGYLFYKKESKLLWIPMAWFGLMETLQAFTYFTLGNCTPSNQVLTYLSYLHIAFQPFFINAIVLYFIPERTRKNIIGWVFTLAFVATIFMLVKLYPFAWAGQCAPGTVLCGENLCSVEGNFHLAWQIPFNDFGGIISIFMLIAYPFVVFVLPFIYGSWKAASFNILAGPVLAYALTNNPNEWPAVWCLLSVAYVSIVLFPKLRNKLKVKKWYFWKYPKKE